MCDEHPPGGPGGPGGLDGVAKVVVPGVGSRRQLLIGGAAATLAMTAMGAATGVARATASITTAVTASVTYPPITVRPGLSIYPRKAWGADLPPKATSRRETPRFMLVHHTASNSLTSTTRNTIRTAYWWQTSSAKGWPDVCYEFFVGRNGDVWEGRNGSLAGPVIADATGGNQGFAQLVCLIGDFTKETPTAAALDSLVRLLAWMAMRDQLDARRSATTSFVSRGSQRWPKGTVVRTPVINGHRSMSYTACPGNNLWNRLGDIRARVEGSVQAWS